MKKARKLAPYQYIKLIVGDDFINASSNQSVRSFLKFELDISIRFIRNIKYKGGELLLNNKPIRFIDTVSKGDEVIIIFPDESSNFELEDKSIDVLYEDDYLLVVNKDPFLVVHPTKGTPNGTLLNRVCSYASNKNEHYKIRLINRLDRDTSGIVLIAKNPLIQDNISKQSKENKIKKTYLLIAHGHIKNKKGIINKPIIKKDYSSPLRIISAEGKSAQTEYEVIKTGEIDDQKLSAIKANLLTGRTHQLRVHFSSIGHPIIADNLYSIVDRDDNLNPALKDKSNQDVLASEMKNSNLRSNKKYFQNSSIKENKKPNSFVEKNGVQDFQKKKNQNLIVDENNSFSPLINRQALHSHSIKFTHPIYKKEMEIVCEPPEDMRRILDAII